MCVHLKLIRMIQGSYHNGWSGHCACAKLNLHLRVQTCWHRLIETHSTMPLAQGPLPRPFPLRLSIKQVQSKLGQTWVPKIANEVWIVTPTKMSTTKSKSKWLPGPWPRRARQITMEPIKPMKLREQVSKLKHLKPKQLSRMTGRKFVQFVSILPFIPSPWPAATPIAIFVPRDWPCPTVWGESVLCVGHPSLRDTWSRRTFWSGAGLNLNTSYRLKPTILVARHRSDLEGATKGVNQRQWFYQGKDGWWKFEERLNRFVWFKSLIDGD